MPQTKDAASAIGADPSTALVNVVNNSSRSVDPHLCRPSLYLLPGQEPRVPVHFVSVPPPCV